MHFLYTCDDNYIWLMGISVISLFENNKSVDNLDVYVLTNNISNSNKVLVNDIAKEYGRRIEVIEIANLKIPQSLTSKRWPTSAYIRLFAGVYLPSIIEKVIYVDCDTIVEGNIEDLEEIDIDKKSIWGVKDCIGKKYKKNIGLSIDDIYINAGILILNLNKLRSVDVSERLHNFMKQYGKRVNYADQDVLNGCFSGDIGCIPPQFNVMTIVASYSYKEIMTLRRPTNYYSEMEIKKAVEKPLIVHFTTNMRTIRPWYYNSNHPRRYEFRKYMSISPWKDRELPKMKFTSFEAKMIGIVNRIPRNVSLIILGILHSEIKPNYIFIKSFIFGKEQ